MALKTYAPEWRRFTDESTDAKILQWTSGESMNHHCYFTNPTTSPDGDRGYFISYRTGHPNLFAIDLDSGEIQQLSDRVDINPFSCAPSLTRPAIYASARNRIHEFNTQTGAERVLCELPANHLGNCSLNRAGTLLAIGARYPDHGELVIVDLESGKTHTACQAAEVGHIQFCPVDDTLLMFSGSARQRIWCHDRNTGRTWWVYEQTPDEWIVHESWRGNSREIIFPHWPRALRAIHPDGSNLRTIVNINAWHACSSHCGDRIVCDTNHPDRGLLLIDPDTGEYHTLCRPKATLRGTQWVHNIPAVGAGIDTSIIRSTTPEKDPPPTPDDKPSTYGPQWSHPHPSFTPDGRHVVFTSDRDRYSHVYSVNTHQA